MRKSWIFTLCAFGVMGLFVALGCSGSSGSGDDDGGDDAEDVATETFENGGLTLTATTTSTGTEKTTTVTDADGNTELTVTVTTAGATISSPNETTTTDITFTTPLDSLPSNFATNRLATYIAAQIELNSSVSARPDNPGCDMFPDTQCTLGCCAVHDACYAANSCTALSWFTLGSGACINCNSVAAACILRACAGATNTGSSDRCYDHRCNEFYDCGGASCECTSPCPDSTVRFCSSDTTTNCCGNGSCEVQESEDNCFTDCAEGGAINNCCVTYSGCADETTTTCGASCCCCGSGEVCNTATDLCASSR